MAEHAQAAPGGATVSRVNDPTQQTRIDLAAAFRMAASLGYQEGMGGHFSARTPGRDGRFLINPLGLFWSEITASSLIVADLEGNKVEGEGELERTAACIHSHIHRACPEAGCVIHTHMPYATAISVLDGGRLEFIHQGSLHFYDKVAYDDRFGGLVTDDQEGQRIAGVMGDKRVLFLANHGQIVTGPTVADAYHYTCTLERMCMYQALARMHGLPLRYVQDDVAVETVRALADDVINGDLVFAGVKRILDREELDYAS